MLVNIPFDVDQAGWGSRIVYADGTKLPWRPDKWVIHYGGGVNRAGSGWETRNFGDQAEIEMSVLRSWQRYHMDTKGWQDIAYNYAIGQSGLVYRLRGENRAGATRGDFEPDGISENVEARAVVFILGGVQVPSFKALAAFQELWKADPLPVIGHRDVALHGVGGTATACPGDFLHTWIGDAGYSEGDDVPQLTEKELAYVRELALALESMGSSGWFAVPSIKIARVLNEDDADLGINALVDAGVVDTAAREEIDEMKTYLRNVK